MLNAIGKIQLTIFYFALPRHFHWRLDSGQMQYSLRCTPNDMM